MKYFLLFIVASILAGFAFWLQFKPQAMVYKKGDTIKNYRFLKDDGTYIETDKLRDKWLVLYFYPQDDTPGCTKEAQTYSSLIDEFKSQKAEIYGLNTNLPESHQKFKQKYDLKVNLLTDENNVASHDFSVRVISGFCARDTVLINPEGKLEQTYRGVNPAGNPVEILNYIKSHQ